MPRRLTPAAIALTVALSACGEGPASPRPADAARPTPTASPMSTTADPTASPPRRAYPAGSLAAFLAEDPRFSMFLELMERDGVLLERLQADPDRAFTLFLPTDDAFARLDGGALDALETDADLVTDVVERHFLYRGLPSGEFTTDFVFAGMSRRWQRLALVLTNDRIWYGDAIVIETDIAVAGGVVHLIDTVNLRATPDRRRVP